MLSNPMLDVAIGLMFLYLLLSVIVKVVQRFILIYSPAEYQSCKSDWRAVWQGSQRRAGVFQASLDTSAYSRRYRLGEWLSQRAVGVHLATAGTQASLSAAQARP
jgi:hypothetical protein